MFLINSFKITFKLPSLNEVINKNRANKYYGNQLKADIERAIGWDIKQALTSGSLKPVEKQCDIYIAFYEKTRRRDTDNIQSGTKFVLDALVKNKILPNDGRKWVDQIYHKVFDADEDYAMVYICPVGYIKLLIEKESKET